MLGNAEWRRAGVIVACYIVTVRWQAAELYTWTIKKYRYTHTELTLIYFGKLILCLRTNTIRGLELTI